MKAINSLLLVLACAGSALGAPLGTSFTYQGRLNDGNSPASGSYDLRFELFDAASGGYSVGQPQTNSAVTVSNGLFTTMLDFGSAPFKGDARWLDIQVRPSGTTTFLPLSPRQALSPTPYAIHAATARSVASGGVSADAIASGQVVKSLNGLRDNVSLVAGANITLTPNGNNLTIASAAGGAFALNGSDAYYNGGNVGIGTSSPTEKLDVKGRFLRVEGDGGEAAYMGGDGIGGEVHVGSLNPAVRSVALYNYGSYQWMDLFADNLNYYGQLNRLDVADQFTAVVRCADFTMGHSGRRGSPGRALVDFGDTLVLNFGSDWAQTMVGSGFLTVYGSGGEQAYLGGDGWGSDVQIGSMNPSVRNIAAYNAGNGSYMDFYAQGGWFGGNVSACSITIRGGCDLAEPFQMSEDNIPKGAVVVIDSENPGHLKMSSSAYDKRVAGIVSGANGINAGISLHQEGLLEGGENVALTGRVYVQADASFGAIEPGDLLTTSDSPGHAMKVTESARAQGAVLGKAMTSLKEGKGMVLVLVSLQ